VGNLDAGMRAVLAVSLLVFGLLGLGGMDGDPVGILVALGSLMPFYMVVTRRCFVFRWFGWSSVPKPKGEP
jgi:hypothetical protein